MYKGNNERSGARANTLKSIQLELFQLRREFTAREKALLARRKFVLLHGCDKKRCAKCGELMNTEQFYKDVRYADGHYPYCIECKCAMSNRRHAERKGNVISRGAAA